jgi:hypothetical protein
MASCVLQKSERWPERAEESAMNQACPVNSETVNNRVVRIVAGEVVLVAVAFVVWPQWWLFLALAADFLLRALGYRKYSPLATIARKIVGALNLEKHPVNAAPKQFAAKIGVGFALTAALLSLLGLTLAAQLVAAGLLGAASLEAFLGYCVGCKIYSLLPRKRVQTA